MAHEPHEPYTIFNDTSTSWTGDLLVYINNVKEQNEIAKSNGNEYAIIKMSLCSSEPIMKSIEDMLI